MGCVADRIVVIVTDSVVYNCPIFVFVYRCMQQQPSPLEPAQVDVVDPPRDAFGFGHSVGPFG